MLRILITLLFLTPINVDAGNHNQRNKCRFFLQKIKSDGDIENSYINEESLEIGFNTKTKLWVWNIKDNKLKSIKIDNSSLRSSEIRDIYFYKPYWIVESHNRLILIDLVKGTNKHLLHPK